MTSNFEYDQSLQLFSGTAAGVMGTRLQVLLCGVDGPLAEDLWHRMSERAATLSGVLNRFDPASEVSRWNAGTLRGDMSENLKAILSESVHWKDLTDGLFDVCYRRDGIRRLLDFGGIAKGWFLEEAVALCGQAGIRDALLDFGGSTTVALGHHPHGDCWKISLPSPWTGRILDVFSLSGGALSVSGNAPGYGGHMVNPSSGEPLLGHVLSAVTSVSPLSAEVLSTAACLADAEQLEGLREKFPECKITVFKDNAG